MGYVPTTGSYESGGYGADAATQDPAVWCRTALPQGAGERIMERLFELGDSMYTDCMLTRFRRPYILKEHS